MSDVDARDMLGAEPFSHRAGKDGTLTVFHQGRLARILKGREAEKLRQVIEAGDAFAAQLAMAKATGNFKHGNERRGR